MPVTIYLIDEDLAEELGVHHHLPVESETNLSARELMDICQEIKPYAQDFWVEDMERKRLGFGDRPSNPEIDKQRVSSVLKAWGFIQQRNAYWYHVLTDTKLRLLNFRITCGDTEFYDEASALACIAEKVFE